MAGVKRAPRVDDHPHMGLRAALVAVAALAFAGCGQSGGVKGFGPEPTPSKHAVAPVPSPPALEEPLIVGAGRELAPSLAIAHLRRDTLRREAYERWRLAELAKAKRSTTVAGALRRALLARRITRREHARLRGQYGAAGAALGRLTGLRRSELAAVVANVDALAAAHRLTAGRFEPVFLVLRRNLELGNATRRSSSTTPGRGCSSSSSRAGGG
jgi:hypothetical protein